jgi:hypothetical protein
MDESPPGKQALVALKGVLRVLSHMEGGLREVDARVQILIELAFMDNVSYMYRCYFSCLKGFGDATLESVMRGWVSRLREVRAVDNVGALELVKGILGEELFSLVWYDAALLGLQYACQAFGSVLSDAKGGGFDDADDKVLEKVSSIAYSIVGKGLLEGTEEGNELIKRCLELTVVALEIVEEQKVELLLAQLVGHLRDFARLLWTRIGSGDIVRSG